MSDTGPSGLLAEFQHQLRTAVAGGDVDTTGPGTVGIADLSAEVLALLGAGPGGVTDAAALLTGFLSPDRIGAGSLALGKLAEDVVTPAELAQALTGLGGGTPSPSGPAYKPHAYDLREFVQAGETLATDGTPGNNSAILQRALDTLSAGTRPRTVWIPDGDYTLADSGQVSSARYGVRLRTRVGIEGESTKGTRILADATSTPLFGAYGPLLEDVVFRTLTVDCAAQTNATYTTQLKGVFAQDMLRPVWDRTVIANSWGTGLGCDYLRDYRIDNHMSIGCGRGIVERGANPLAVSGGSGIGIGTGKYQDERGVITAPVLLRNGKNGLFYEVQTSVTYHSRGHQVIGGVSAGNHTGLHDCGCDGLDVSGLQLVDNAYAGLLLSGTILEPNAGYNGRFEGLIARNGTVADGASGGVVIGSLPGGRYLIEGVVSGNAVGVNTRPDAAVGPGVRVDADVRDNLGAGVHVASTSTTPVRSLHIGGRVLSNGRSVGATRREGVVIGVPTKNLTVSAAIGDDQAVPTQQVGLYLRGAGLACESPRITSDLRGNVLPFQSEQTLTDLSYAGVGASLVDPSALTATPGDGQVALSWGAPVSASDVTDYQVQYKTAAASTWTTAVRTPGTGTTHTVTGLPNDTAHDFRVAALRGATASAYTNTVRSTPTVAAGAVVYTDTFDRADSPDTPGEGWSSVSGTWGILANKLHLYSTSVAREVLRTAARPSPNHGLSFLPIRNNSANIGAAIRRAGPSDYYGVRINNTNSCALTKTLGGTASILGSEHPWVAGQRVAIEAFGTTLRLLIAGVVVETVTVNDAALASATGTSLRATGSSTPPEYDDFLQYLTTA